MPTLICLLTVLLGADAARGDRPEFPGELSKWNGFVRHDFEVNGKPVLVVSPRQAAPGRPWVWHGEFFGHKPAPDVALLERGFHVVYMSVPNRLGSPGAVEHWNACYVELTGKYGLAKKVALVGLSRGGLYCYNWAIANPDRVACLYGDAPVCDFKSWPGGKLKWTGQGKGSPADWQRVLDQYGFADDAAALAYDGNPVDQLQGLAQAGVPLLHVYGDADDVVPWEENTGVIAERYRALGGPITLIAKSGVGHHPHGLDDSTPIVEFIARHAQPPMPDGPRCRVEPVEVGAEGLRVHRLRSPFQSAAASTLATTTATASESATASGQTEVQVLLPDHLPPGRRARVLFVLPVEAQRGDRWGNGLQEVQRANLHNEHGLICVMPTFAQLPWYADHPSDPAIRQERYLVEDVLELLRWEYPQARHDRDGRWLVGFSKSGWGAWSLLLRHPDTFARAAAWDAPLMLAAPGPYGSGPIFGTVENFRHYQLSRQLREHASEFSSRPARLIHLGYGNFRAEHDQMEALLRELSVAHIYHAGPQREHHWNSGWLPEAVAALLSPE
ncbi:MAG: alpha/beta hydrolase-fold protein [Planctomycetaceae bacterium]